MWGGGGGVREGRVMGVGEVQAGSQYRETSYPSVRDCSE